MLRIQAIPGIETREELRDYILRHSCYSEDESLRIYQKWFAGAPRYLFRAVHRKYSIADKMLCDVGCSYGMNLVFCSEGSFGIEIDEYAVKFARSLGLTVYQRNVLQDEVLELPKAEVVWCSAVLEHVDSPHIFLRKLHMLLKPGGLLTLYVPTIPLIPWLRHLPGIGKYFCGHLASDHVNAFTLTTLKFFCERAGFKTVEVSPFFPCALRLFDRVPVARQMIDGCVYIGEKIDGWEYPEKATRRVALNSRGFEFKEAPIRDDSR